MIEIDQLTFGYSGHSPIFDCFSWRAERGESWAVIGSSGCGKTTLLYLLAGLRRPSSGSIRVAAVSLVRPRPETGLILQDHGLLPWATIQENAALGLKIRKFYGPDGRHAPRAAPSQDHVEDWLKRLGLDGLSNKYPSQLSGGQRQRTAIARTLALSPDLLLMDEPFSALDAPTREDLQNLTAALRRETMQADAGEAAVPLTTVIVTHNIEEAVFLGERILVLNRPPNHEPRAIDNPHAGKPGYRSDPEFASMCGEVRARLGGLV